MKTLKLQGHEIEYPEEWADDFFKATLTFHNQKLAIIEVRFFDKKLNFIGLVEKEINQSQQP